MNKLILEEDDCLYDTVTNQYIRCPCIVSQCGWGCSSECNDFRNKGNVISCDSTGSVLGELVPEESKRIVIDKEEIERIRTFEAMAGHIAGGGESHCEQSLRIAKYIIAEKIQKSVSEMVAMYEPLLSGDVIVRVLP